MPKNALRQRTDQAEDSLRELLFRFRLPLFLAMAGFLALFARVALWPHVSGDFVECLDVWMNEIRSGRGFHSIGTQVGNYTAPYHYLMALMSYIPGLDNLLAIKIPSTIADFCLAAAVGLLVWRLSASRGRAALAAVLALCLPTVLLNSAAWGQCDAMFSTFAVLFLCFYLGGRPGTAVFMYGLALSMKLQAIFILPALLIFWLCGKLRLRHLLCGAAGYVLAFLPAMLAAGSLSPLWRAYAMQARVNALASNIPNLASLFTGVTEFDLPLLAPALTLCCFAVLGAVAAGCWGARERFSGESAFLLVALCACLAPFLLPAMKDRYYYLAEVLCLAYALWRPRRFWAPLCMQLAGLPSYTYYLYGGENPFGALTVLMAMVAPAFLCHDLLASLADEKTSKLRCHSERSEESLPT